jgi:hypothetical protein
VEDQTRGGGTPTPSVRLLPLTVAGEGAGRRGSPGKRGRPREAGYVAPNAVHERALSATGLSYEGRCLADTELLTPPKTHDESMEHLHRPHSASPYRLLRWPLTPDAHHLVRALALAPTTALRFP